MIDLSLYRTVIFDLDGTLYDKGGLPLRLIFGDLRNMLVLRDERVARKEMKGKSYPSSDALYADLFSRVAERRGMDRRSVATWYREKYMPLTIDILSRHYKARPGVQELFSSLRGKGISVVVLSDYGYVEEKLRAVGIDPAWADLVVDASSIGGFKPCPDTFRSLAGRFPGPFLVIGDRDDTDGEGARSAGMDFFHVRGQEDWDALFEQNNQ